MTNQTSVHLKHGIDVAAVKAKHERFFDEVFAGVEDFVADYVRKAPEYRVAHVWNEDGNTYLDMVGDMTNEIVIIAGLHDESGLVNRACRESNEAMEALYRAHDELRAQRETPEPADDEDTELIAAPRFTTAGYIPPGDLTGYEASLRRHRELASMSRR